MNTPNRILSILACVATLSACAAPGNYGYGQPGYGGALTGAAVGAAGGALLGYAADGGRGNGAVTGGALGAVAGGAVGYAMDRNQERSDPYPSYPQDRSGYRPR
ncbi:glycine zipper domain-containing protein [Methylomagnum ishizawai]|uniref:glycine zipper domain-containing protein n=1 Tax=Methylomagnum ishizawai TaxID=1760988 RepID=UPI001C3201A9|nr:glycine zipper domain-containing protein [Methylomagnum ishizawai]BBL75066.1 hypothetical protein MishRS11D_21640 [Methylomagnum ishizawai]